ncbi:MAG: hypothetical protein WCB74_16230 [Pseudolabrys sp.]
MLTTLLTGLVLPALLLTTLTRFVLAALLTTLTTLALLAALLLLVLIISVWIVHRYFLTVDFQGRINEWQMASFLCHLTQLGTTGVREMSASPPDGTCEMSARCHSGYLELVRAAMTDG